jgi:CPA1 family monovalent cation:H+ antiporter
MLMMIPASFEHLEMLKAVVVGVIMPSTFVYAVGLITIIGAN